MSAIRQLAIKTPNQPSLHAIPVIGTVLLALLVALAGCDRKSSSSSSAPSDESSTAARQSSSPAPAAAKSDAASRRPAAAPAPAAKPFIEREDANDLRIVVFNIDSVYPERKYLMNRAFKRVVKALDPDILALQEIGGMHSAEFVAEMLDEIMPLADGAKWHAYKGTSNHMANLIAARFPLSMTGDVTVPPAREEGDRQARVAFALIDLPDDRFATDLYLTNHHFKSSGGEANDELRQEEADALVNWLRDARTPGDSVDLPENTPIVVVGDLNTVGGPQIIKTVLTGDIQDEQRFGADAAPDWDDSPMTDAKPKHNAVGPDVYTWRNDRSEFDPGRLDYVIYSDSVMEVAHSFVLNTTTMSEKLLADAGLETYDVCDDGVGVVFDHLPLVVDFRLPAPSGE